MTPTPRKSGIRLPWSQHEESDTAAPAETSAEATKALRNHSFPLPEEQLPAARGPTMQNRPHAQFSAGAGDLLRGDGVLSVQG